MRIFIRNPSKQVEEDGLLDLFEPYGEVASATLITDKASGRRVGFGVSRFSQAIRTTTSRRPAPNSAGAVCKTRECSAG